MVLGQIQLLRIQWLYCSCSSIVQVFDFFYTNSQQTLTWLIGHRRVTDFARSTAWGGRSTYVWGDWCIYIPPNQCTCIQALVLGERWVLRLPFSKTLRIIAIPLDPNYTFINKKLNFSSMGIETYLVPSFGPKIVWLLATSGGAKSFICEYKRGR